MATAMFAETMDTAYLHKPKLYTEFEPQKPTDKNTNLLIT
jgi:hypothetical protein